MNTHRMRWSTLADAALVIVATVESVLDAAATSGGFTDLSVAVALVAGLSLAIRHRWPLIATAAAVAAAGGWGVLYPLLVVLFHLADRGRVWLAVVSAGIVLAANALVHPMLSLWTPRGYGPVLVLMLVLVIGMWAGRRRRLVDTLAAQVDHLRIERGLREQGARLAERAAIAAEMHDVLAHRLSLIALHTGVLATKKDTLPTPITDRVDLLRTAAANALADLRDVLGALRATGQSQIVPAPTLRDVKEVIEQARAAGQTVEDVIDGPPEQAPAAHRLAVFRLLQEALTNARKHAPGAPVTIHVRYSPPDTLVEVTNLPGAHPTDTVPSGLGLIGLTERVEALGGTLHAGPSGAGTWRIAASIPHPSTEQNGPRT